jgi:hypothetical protein
MVIPGTLTRDEFKATMDRLYDTTDQGFKAMNERLDQLNGRTLKGEIADAELRTRVTSLEKELFSRPRRRRQDHAGEGEEWAAAFTKREYALMSLGIAVIGVLLKLIEFLGERLWHVLTAGKA